VRENMPEIIKTQAVAEILGLSTSSVRAGVKAGILPAPIKLTAGRRTMFWEKSDILDFIEKSRNEAKRNG
jgi:predicted DNA-binding transcriptional regulator AlpA